MWHYLNPFVCLLSLIAAVGSPASAQTAARTSIKVTDQGLVRVHDLRVTDEAAFRRAPAPSPVGTSLWSYDHATATADGVAIDGSLAWSSWRFTGSGLRAYGVLGDGTPALEFNAGDDVFAGIDAARGADRSLLIESGAGLDDYWLHSFTSQSAGTPDWSFSIPMEAPVGPVISFKNVAVSYDGSTGAVALHDSDADQSALYVFDAATGEILLTWAVPDWMLAVDLTDDGSLALVTHTQLATVIDTATGEIVFQTSAPTNDGYYRISGDGSILVLASNELSVLQANGETYEEIIHLAIPESAFDSAAVVSRDGSTVAAVAEDWGTNFLAAELYIYDVASTALLGTYAVSGSGEFQGNFVDAAASDDGSVLAFASWGTEFEDWPEIMVFDRDAELIGEISFPGSAFAVDVSADGQYVVGGAKAVHANEFGNGGRVELIEVVGGGIGPVADVSPGSLELELPAGESDTRTLDIGNIGDAELAWSLEEAEAAAAKTLVPAGVPYRHDVADVPAFHAPKGSDRAAGRSRGRGAAPADPIVLPAPQAQAIGDFTEGFDDIQQLPSAGWAMINNSDPAGPTSWFQGNESIFPAHEGAPNAYIAANYESTAGNGTISNWLLTPEVTIVNGTEACFWTRKSDLFGEFLDRLEVRMSAAGDSIDVGETADSVGDFTTLLLTIEPDLELPNEYPEEWTEFCVAVRERSREPVSGRFAFRYWVTDSGPEGTHGDYIGIDTVSVTQPGDVPTPAGCDNPTDIPWLAVDPTSGTTSPADSSPVTVSVDAASLDPGDYAARLCVTTNDPAAPLIEVPVSLTVTEAGASGATLRLTRRKGRPST